MRFVLLGGELDGAVQQVHLVDEQIAEDAGAVDDDVDARAAEFFQRNNLELVHSAESIRAGLTPTINMTCAKDSPYVLMLSVPHKTKSDGLRVDAVVLDALTFNQTVDDNLGGGNRGTRSGSLAGQGVDVLTGRQNLRVTDRITARARKTYCRRELPPSAPSSLSLTTCSRQKRR